MDFNLADRLPFLNRTQRIIFAGLALLIISCPAEARVTFEAVTADGAKIYSGDSLSTSPLINLTIISNNDLSAGADAIVFKIDGSGNNLTPSSRSAGTITASHQPTLGQGTHRFTISVKEVAGTTTTWEATNLIVDTGNTLEILGEPLNFPNPCNADAGGTSIGYQLSKPAATTVSIHDLMGNLIWKRSYSSGANGGRAPYNEITWDGKTDSGQVVGNGIYVYLIVGEGKLIGKGRITVIK